MGKLFSVACVLFSFSFHAKPILLMNITEKLFVPVFTIFITETKCQFFLNMSRNNS